MTPNGVSVPQYLDTYVTFGLRYINEVSITVRRTVADADSRAVNRESVVGMRRLVVVADQQLCADDRFHSAADALSLLPNSVQSRTTPRSVFL